MLYYGRLSYQLGGTVLWLAVLFARGCCIMVGYYLLGDWCCIMVGCTIFWCIGAVLW